VVLGLAVALSGGVVRAESGDGGKFTEKMLLDEVEVTGRYRLASGEVVGLTPAEVKAPVVPGKVVGKDGVKTYLLETLKEVRRAVGDFKGTSDAYTGLIEGNGGTAEAAAKAKPEEMAKLIKKMRDEYTRIDSYGYEYVEGIVAGVPVLNKFDVELDSGLPAKEASEEAPKAEVTIKAGDLEIKEEGSLNNYLIEQAVFGTNARFTSGAAELPGLGKVKLPNPQLVKGLADYAVDGYTRLEKAAKAWQPTDADCFQVLASMTPTLAGYFEEWKESKKGNVSGRFVAVTRVSDMRGIMSGVRLTWGAVADSVKAKDEALAKKITGGYDEIMAFIDTVEDRDKKKPLTLEAVDKLGSQAKEKADALTVQSVQAAKLVGVEVK
jgi:hypothetical protein